MLNKPKEFKPTVTGGKSPMNPNNMDIKHSEYAIALVQDKNITPMFDVPVNPSGTLGHSAAYEVAEGLLQDFIGEHTPGHKYIKIPQYYEGLFNGLAVINETRFVCLEHGYYFIIRNQLTHQSFEERKEIDAINHHALQTAFLTWQINNGQKVAKEEIVKDNYSVETRLALVVQGHVEEDLEWLDENRSKMPSLLTRTLESVWQRV